MAIRDRFKKAEIISEHEFSSENPQQKIIRGRKRIGEMIGSWNLGVRSSFRGFRKSFWPGQVAFEGAAVSYAKTRALYRNDDGKSNLGGGFSRRIINSTPDYMGMPRSVSGDVAVDDFLNNAIQDAWGSDLTQVIRDACRDSKTILRYRRENPDNPLVTAEEWANGYLEVVPPESVEIYYTDNTHREIERAYVTYSVDEIIDDGLFAATKGLHAMALPQVQTHNIVEEITPTDFRYFDESTGNWRDDLAAPNSWGFVPLIEVFNEYDSALSDGQSDLEAVAPFILAFHDVMAQSLSAHKYHSIPKAKFKIHDLMSFLANNWPESFEKDENGEPIMSTFTGEISWKGTEILFMEADEDAAFMEARSVLGDSRTLMEFLLECISTISETPKSILMNAKQTDADESLVFEKKIERKRKFFAPYFQTLCKMALKVNGFQPIRPQLTWAEINPQTAVTKAQALQQDTMSLEVLRNAQVVSDNTVREHLRQHLPGMAPGPQEAAAARNNVPLPTVSPNSTTGSESGKGN